ncbi:MAG: hypothetical protein KZQ99_19205 [Candidatus Thiodiazotropha sp. (ex Dulcina madagascariensis)]|nr:hypothetical protein [Candidatus Thiodiazotropha sp. (ex Dulcina madagascariensis)]
MPGTINKQYINLLKNELPKTGLGVLRDYHLYKNDIRFVLIFQDNPENWSVRWSIAQILKYFKTIDIACQIGTNGRIDNLDGMHLLQTIPDDEIRDEVARYFFRKLVIQPAEYANLHRGAKNPFELYGVEDPKLYEQALSLFGNQPKFLPHQIVRAKAIVKNMLNLITEKKQSTVILICDGDIPDLVCDELDDLRISYAVVRPEMTYPSDKGLYRTLLSGKVPQQLDMNRILSDYEQLPPLPKGSFPDKELDNVKEAARAKLVGLIKSGELLLMLIKALPEDEIQPFEHIIKSSEYSLRSKAVLIKGEFLSWIGSHKFRIFAATYIREKILPLLLLIGLGGATLVSAGVIFDLTTKSWFIPTIISIYGIASIGLLITKRFIHSFGWLLHALGFFSGYYYWGAWGGAIGVVLATLIWWIALPRQKNPENEEQLVRTWTHLSRIFL